MFSYSEAAINIPVIHSVAQSQVFTCLRGPHSLTHGGPRHSSPASPPKYGHPSCTSGVAMAAGDVGAHAKVLALPHSVVECGDGP